MKIQTVTYSRLVSGPGYSNTTIGATAILETQDTPESALAQIEAWVGEQHSSRDTTSQVVATLEQERWDLQRKNNTLLSEISDAQRRYEAIKRLSERLGIDLLARVSDLDDIPF